jgi:hypothetical protein
MEKTATVSQISEETCEEARKWKEKIDNMHMEEKSSCCDFNSLMEDNQKESLFKVKSLNSSFESKSCRESEEETADLEAARLL